MATRSIVPEGTDLESKDLFHGNAVRHPVVGPFVPRFMDMDDEAFENLR